MGIILLPLLSKPTTPSPESGQGEKFLRATVESSRTFKELEDKFRRLEADCDHWKRQVTANSPAELLIGGWETRGHERGTNEQRGRQYHKLQSKFIALRRSRKYLSRPRV
jgi:hypothetical protein